MAKFRVGIYERWIQYHIVEADDTASAIEKIYEGEGDVDESPGGMEYVARIDIEPDVEEIEEGK